MSPGSATLHVLTFSNFEGFCSDKPKARRIVDGFEQIGREYPDAVWTHMFNPRYLLGTKEHREAGEVFVAYLTELRSHEPRTEIGLHLHMYDDLVAALGVRPRGVPYSGAPPGDCLAGPDRESNGYDVLMTGFTANERRRLVEGSVESLVRSGLPRPRSFCAGYSATDPAMQAMLEECGFTTSFAAQVLPRGVDGVSYPDCWYELLEWGEGLTPLVQPYRVPRDSILPRAGAPLLDRLVEIPLNADTDTRPPYLNGEPVSRRSILDAHFEMIRTTGADSSVALGLHDVYLADEAARGDVLDEMLSSLAYAEQIGLRGEGCVRFSTASEVSARLHAESDGRG